LKDGRTYSLLLDFWKKLGFLELHQPKFGISTLSSKPRIKVCTQMEPRARIFSAIPCRILRIILFTCLAHVAGIKFESHIAQREAVSSEVHRRLLACG
jgi:hypothetical protein